MVHVPPIVHLVTVGTAGALAAAAAITLSVIAVRRNDGRAVLLGFAFSVMAVLLVFHALATPGVLIGDNGLVQAAGALSIPLGGLILAASALPALRRPRSAASAAARTGAAPRSCSSERPALLACPDSCRAALREPGRATGLRRSGAAADPARLPGRAHVPAHAAHGPTCVVAVGVMVLSAPSTACSTQR